MIKIRAFCAYSDIDTIKNPFGQLILVIDVAQCYKALNKIFRIAMRSSNDNFVLLLLM